MSGSSVGSKLSSSSAPDAPDGDDEGDEGDDGDVAGDVPSARIGFWKLLSYRRRRAGRVEASASWSLGIYL